MALRWFTGAVGCEGTPLLYADRGAYDHWRGVDEHDGANDYQRVVVEEGFTLPTEIVMHDGVAIGLLDSEGDVTFDVGCDEREVVALGAYVDEDDPKRAERTRAAVAAKKKHPEYLVGALEIGPRGLVLANSGASSAAIADIDGGDARSLGRDHFFVPLPAGRYVVLEGRDGEDDYSAWWCRILPASKKKYAKRPTPQPSDPVADIMARVSFKDAVAEARALEDALELVTLGRAELALSLCDRASSDRRWLAAFTRVIALAATKDARAAGEASAVAEAWLRPADSRQAANQMLTRAQVLRALDAAGADAELRARVVAAPEPDVFIDGGVDFF